MEIKSASPTKLPLDKLEPLKRPNVQTAAVSPNVVALESESGWDRVKAMYRKDEYGLKSPEMILVSQGAFVSGLTGVMLGGYFGGRQAHLEFIKKNEVTLFYGHQDGRRRLNDHVMLGTMRKAFSVGWRLSLFTSCYLASMLTISTYRNKASIWEFIAAGGLTGAAFKFNLGLKGMISGGVIGSATGIIPGVVTLSMMWLSGSTLGDIREKRNKLKDKYRSELQLRHEEVRLNRSSGALDPLALAHDSRLKSENCQDD